MISKRYFVLPCVAVMAAVFCLSSNALADDWDQKTAFSINQPVSVPGRVVLPAGSYVIKRLNATTPVVQILNASETQVFATLMPVPDFVDNPSDKPSFTFQEMPEGSPAALRTFHYAGEQIGYEFVPPRASHHE
jgi:hypothetical protein